MNYGWSCDFETITTEPTRVWLWGAFDIETSEKFSWGTTIDSFFEWCWNKKKLYFHNLKFDGAFIIDYLFRKGFKYVHDRKKLENNCFTSLVSLSGIWYSITIKINGRTLNIYDSYKKLPFSARVVAESYKLKISKGKIDYKANRDRGYVPSDQEIEYVKTDVRIIADALRIQMQQGLTKMTAGSDALNFYKLGCVNWKDWFPQLELSLDKELRKSYKGGYVYLNPIFKNKWVENVTTYDVNSMYPFVMKTKPMPYGHPVFFEGEYVKDDIYNIYIIKISVMFTLKDGKLPTIQLKGNWKFNQTEYISNVDEPVTLYLTSVDYELFIDHYHIDEITFICGWKFKSYVGLFNDYIDYWMKIKSESEGGIRAIAKLMLNSLYGKFAKNPDTTRKGFTFDQEWGIIKLEKREDEISDTLYLPVGSFITSWARNELIRTCQSNISNFIYCDTDSITMRNGDQFNGRVDKFELGSWKNEGTFWVAYFIRSKCNVKISGYHCHVTCAGMPDEVKKKVRVKNNKKGHVFREGAVYDGKLVYKIVEGGAILKETTFKILEEK